MNATLTAHDHWLDDPKRTPPAALVIREHLMPVEGLGGVVFPPTFAAEEGNAPDRFKGGYNIDGPLDGDNICLIDSVGSQANRIEPSFARDPYCGLVPMIQIRAGEKTVSILDAGHRGGDAIIRCTELQGDFQAAFRAVLMGDAEPLAKLAPTSLIFGVWDSRDTQARLPRLVASTIRAFNVRKLTRGAQFVPAANYVDDGLLDAPADKAARDAYAQRGFTHVPSSATPGGIIATGGIRRDATLNLAALRLLHAGTDADRTTALRRYILGLTLIAFTHPSAYVGYLRQGCTLVLDPDATPSPREFTLVHPDGNREAYTLTHDEALDYARSAAEGFGIGEDRVVEFNKKRAKADLAGDTKPAKRTTKKSAK